MLDSDFNPTNYPDLAAAHVLSEFAYASLPPPSTEQTSTTLQERYAPQWIDLLRRAVEEPGLISEAYSRFHGYSLGNRFAALLQCQDRGLEPGPLSTFNGWRKLGYAVQEGERALSLCMPLKGVLAREKAVSPTVAAKRDDTLPDIEEIEYIRAFVWKPHWFVLAQTQPINPDTVQPIPSPTLNGWDKDKALAALDIHEVAFSHLDGNTQGYAQKREIAVSPLASFPYKTLFHEMAHVVLGHTDRDGKADPLVDTLSLPRSQIEVEAEGVALLLLDTFDLPGQEYSRGYIQHWLQGEEIPEKSAQRIFGGADRILSAGLGEGRVRFPTADDLGWPDGSAATTDNSAVNGIESTPQPIPQSGAVSASPTEASTRLATPHLEYDRGKEAHRAPASLTGAFSDALTVPNGAAHAWKLHQRLMLLHSELHPDDRAQRHSLARAVSYLEHLNPEAATQVRDLVSGASRSLKAAFARLESTLDDPFDGGWETENETPASTDQPSDAAAETAAATSGVLFTPEPAPLPAALPATREASARRTVGRDLRQELRLDKKSFFDAAKAQGLKVGGQHEKAMLAALGEFLGIAVESRRTPSARQWAQAASAITTDDLRW